MSKLIRISDELYELLEKAGTPEKRSVDEEVTLRLEHSLELGWPYNEEISSTGGTLMGSDATTALRHGTVTSGIQDARRNDSDTASRSDPTSVPQSYVTNWGRVVKRAKGEE